MHRTMDSAGRWLRLMSVAEMVAETVGAKSCRGVRSSRIVGGSMRGRTMTSAMRADSKDVDKSTVTDRREGTAPANSTISVAGTPDRAPRIHIIAARAARTTPSKSDALSTPIALSVQRNLDPRCPKNSR